MADGQPSLNLEGWLSQWYFSEYFNPAKSGKIYHFYYVFVEEILPRPTVRTGAWLGDLYLYGWDIQSINASLKSDP